MAGPQRLLLALVLVLLAGCAGEGGAPGDSQAFLGISQDIRAVFSNGNLYRSPARSALLGD